MNLGEIDLSLQPIAPQLSICLPDLNQTVIGNLSETYDISYDMLLGKINELSFKVCHYVERQNDLVKNPNIVKLKERYLIKLQLGNTKEFFIINDINDSGDDNGLVREIHCYSLAWELNDKLFRSYSDNVNARVALNQALLQSNWDVNYVDSDFEIRTRQFDVDETTILNFLFQVADTFAGILQFDTVNRSVSLVKEDSVGQNKGLYLSYGKYLKSLGKESDSSEMTTRLHVYGAENLSIQRINPTGSTFIESFDFFLYPFQRDENRNVISHSNYMSDSLCHAILDYQAKIESKKGEFTSLLDQIGTQQGILATKQVELDTLKNELNIIQDKIDMGKAVEDDTSSLEVEKANKQTQINNKQAEIDTVNAGLTSLNTSLTNLRNDISVENNFTPEQIQERNYYIIEKTWTDDNFVDDQDLYDEAIKRFKEMKQPATTFTIDVVDFLSIVEEQRNWDKLSLGDTVTIEYEQLGIKVGAKIIEIHRNYEDNSITLTISNTFDIKSAEERVLDKLYDSYSTSTSLDMSKYKWNGAVTGLGEVNDVINSDWDATKREISFGVNNSISLSGRGLIATDIDEPNKMLILQAGRLALSQDNGNTWKTAVKPDKIVAELVMGKLIAGVNLTIQNETGKYTIDGQGFNITNNDNTVKIGLTTTDGIKIQKKNGTEWKDQFYVDSTGTLYAEDLITKRLKMRDTNDITLIDAETKTINFDAFTTKFGKLTADNIDTTTLTLQNLVTKNYNGYTIATIQRETMGGQLRIYDEIGQLNAVIGSESGTGENVGGTLTLYNDGTYNKRVSIGIVKSGDYGIVQLQDNNGITRVQLKPQYVMLYDSSNNLKTYLTEVSGFINNEQIATQNWVNGKNYLTSVPTTATFYTMYLGGAFVYSGGWFQAQGNGTLRIGQNSVEATSITELSNADFKKNITTWEGNALDKICSTPVKQFQYVNELDEEFPHIGIIVQEAPVEVVDLTGSGINVGAKGSLLWKGVQELKAELDTVKAELELIKSQLN